MNWKTNIKGITKSSIVTLTILITICFHFIDLALSQEGQGEEKIPITFTFRGGNIDHNLSDFYNYLNEKRYIPTEKIIIKPAILTSMFIVTVDTIARWFTINAINTVSCVTMFGEFVRSVMALQASGEHSVSIGANQTRFNR